MGRKKKLKPRNFIGVAAKVVIRHHVVDRYAERAGVDHVTGRNTLVKKFLNSKLLKIYPDGSEKRAEVCSSMDKRLQFVAYYKPKTNTYIVVTCYLQGSKDNWWKNEGLIIEEPLSKEEYNKAMNDITEEMSTYFEEEISNG